MEMLSSGITLLAQRANIWPGRSNLQGLPPLAIGLLDLEDGSIMMCHFRLE